jgi:N-acetylneuraminic acid mutarotase
VNASWSANPKADHIILFGGEHFDGKACIFFNDLFVYEIKENVWYKVVTALEPGPRSSHQAVWGPDGKLYVFGGEFGTSKETRFLHYRDFWCLDTANWTWTSLNVNPLPPARSGHRMTTWANFIILFGGFIDTIGTTTYLDDLWLFDFVKQSWKKVDWLNVSVPKPSPRSAFQLCAFEDGALLYGGYCQVKAKNGSYKGEVLNDIWVLKMDSEDLTQLRWDKKKTVSTAPLPRSGCASTRFGDKLLVFGGVFDEDVSDEFIQGTCSNDLYLYNFKTNKWTKVEYGLVDASGSSHQICPRLNAMMATSRTGQAFAFGGIWEIGDVQYTLDDLYAIDPKDISLIKVLKNISVDLSNWKEMIEADRREMMMSEDDDDSDSDSSNNSSDEESDDEGFDQALSTEEAQDGVPVINRKKHRTLKDYFDDSSDYWIGRARADNPVGSDKDLRKAAFIIAKTTWDEASLVDSIGNL